MKKFYIEPISNCRAGALARGALQTASAFLSAISINKPAQTITDNFKLWFEEHGRRYVQLGYELWNEAEFNGEGDGEFLQELPN